MKFFDLFRKYFDQRLLNYVRKFLYVFFGASLGKGVVFYGSTKIIGFYSKIKIGDECVINEGVVFNSRDKIEVGNRVHLSSYCKIYTGRLDLSDRSKHLSAPVKIGDDVWVGSAAIILGGVTIANGAVVAAGSVVTRDVIVPGLYAGVPAKLIKVL